MLGNSQVCLVVGHKNLIKIEFHEGLHTEHIRKLRGNISRIQCLDFDDFMDDIPNYQPKKAYHSFCWTCSFSNAVVFLLLVERIERKDFCSRDLEEMSDITLRRTMILYTSFVFHLSMTVPYQHLDCGSRGWNVSESLQHGRWYHQDVVIFLPAQPAQPAQPHFMAAPISCVFLDGDSGYSPHLLGSHRSLTWQECILHKPMLWYLWWAFQVFTSIEWRV